MRSSPQPGWIRLVAARGLGARTLDKAGIERERWPELYRDSRAELLRSGLPATAVDSLLEPEPERMACIEAWLAVDGHNLIAIDDAYYPPLLRRIPDPPPVLFVNGKPETLLQPQLAIVGSRNATAVGQSIAAEFATALVRAGLSIASGLALGIDGAAHRGALEAGGATVAVIGTGPDRIYPARHRDLAHQIVDNGAVISSLIPGTGVRPGHFPARNRIISGISAGVLVVEAGLRSGSLITARMAGEQGREVFAVPGSIRNPLARGCHQLLRQGARLVERADEIVAELAPLVGELAGEIHALLGPDDDGPTTGSDDAETAAVLTAMGHEPCAVDELIACTGLDAARISALLLELELDGRVTDLGGGRFCRIR
ncbi:MAG: DNA-processing protein DprA [Wenzhouxiangellaceae bacterium]|nr:DNA-processing protein DprA [Wenzhouxiangellaceae bacterium]